MARVVRLLASDRIWSLVIAMLAPATRQAGGFSARHVYATQASETPWLDPDGQPIVIEIPIGEPTGFEVTMEQAVAADIDALLADIPALEQAELIRHLKDVRWQSETGGVVVTIAGEPVRVSTNRGDDRAALHQEHSALVNDLRVDGSGFNFADGQPRAVSNADMMVAVMSALSHVRAAFDAELAVTPAIRSGALTTMEDVEAAFAAELT